MHAQELQLEVSPRIGRVSALVLAPERPRLTYVLAHGAGAGMRHSFLEMIAVALAERGIATFRYQFPYMEAGGRRTDPAPVAEATVRAAVEAAAKALPGIPLIAGGKSFGGRMTSQAQAKEALPGVRGLAFLGFPLHPAGEPSIKRADHLTSVTVPMLFLQGTRDELAELELIKKVCGQLPTAKLHVVAGGDHSFAVLKRDGRTADEVRTELADTLSQWATEICQ